MKVMEKLLKKSLMNGRKKKEIISFMNSWNLTHQKKIMNKGWKIIEI